jgi:hypothetical protein
MRRRVAVRATDYQYLLTIISPAGTTDAAGHIDYTAYASWTTQGQRWFALQATGMTEIQRGNQIETVETFECRTPSDSLTETMVSTWALKQGSIVYQIESVIERNESEMILKIYK